MLPRTLLYFAVSHLYLFWRFFAVFGKRRAFLFSLSWFAAMGLFPWVHLLLPADGAVQTAFALVGSVWQPFAFFCLTVFLPFDVFRLGAWTLRRLFSSFRAVPRLGSRPALLCILVWGCVFAYGVYEARSLRVTHLSIPNALPAGSKPLHVVFAADLHISPQTRLSLLPQAVDLILEQQPDCILLGGDILDDAQQGTPQDLAQLARLKAPLGVFGVLGNHDAFGDVERVERVVAATGIKLLSTDVYSHYTTGPLQIIGEEDPLVREQTRGRKRVVFDISFITEMVKQAQRNGPKPFLILLEHRPLLQPESVGVVDLQLSGHTHGGQIFALEPLMRKEYGVPTGYSEHRSERGETRLFVTTGVGFSKMPIRLLVPPEIVYIDLLPSK